ncbi:MAG: energy transducer TonB [Desulfobacteraceae bacterium]|nr:energy transducer TonB [Desulfobacteraceae bacterium]
MFWLAVIGNNKIDTDCEIEITNTPVSKTHITFIAISLLFHIIILSVFNMIPQLSGGETPRKPSIEAVFVNLNDPFAPPLEKHSMPSGGGPESKMNHGIKPHKERKTDPLPKPDTKKPQKIPKRNPAPSKPEIFVKNAGTQSDLYAKRDPAPAGNASEAALPAESFKSALKEKTSDPASSGQEAMTNRASVSEGTGSSGQNSWKQSGSGTGKGSSPAELGMGEVEQIPKIIQTTEPVYPRSARSRNVEGKITVKFLVSATGEVTKPSIVSAEPEGIFEENVLKAVSLWKFKPGIYKGKAVATWMILPVLFKIN